MQNIVVTLTSEMGNSFRCVKAADSVNLSVSEKSTHKLEIKNVDLSDFNIGVIVGSSGSGKTTLAKKLFGDDFANIEINPDKPIIDSFGEEISYEEVIDCLTGMGLTSIPCWIRPFKTLSNGQQARAEAALKLSDDKNKITVIDEWTSVVDRTVAKVMSHTIQKEARKKNKKVILLSCHYDILDWVNPDFIIDCNKQEFINRKKKGEVESFIRQDCLSLEIRECDKRTWQYFSKYHYLSDSLAPDTKYTFGIFDGKNQIGFCAFTRYAFKNPKMLHSNRVVIHPDYVGLGLGIKMVDACAEYLTSLGFEIRAKFTSVAMLKARLRNSKWKLIDVKNILSLKDGAVGSGIKSNGVLEDKKTVQKRNDAKLYYVKYFTFKYYAENKQ